MTAGTADKVALYWYAEPSVLTHRSWCGDYTHTHACTRTASTQHSHNVATRPQMVCAAVHQCHPWISNADTHSTNGGFITE